MKNIVEKNNLPNKYNKKQATTLGTMKIYFDGVNEMIEEAHRNLNFDKELDIGLISECDYDEDSSEKNEEGDKF